MKTNSADSYEINTISRAFSVLELLSQHQSLGVTEISTALGIHKNNVFRILSTFVKNEYVVQNEETEKYNLTSKLSTLVTSYAVQNSGRVTSLAQEIIQLMQPTRTDLNRVELSVDNSNGTEAKADSIAKLL